MAVPLPEGGASGPGRACPAHYGYEPSVFDRQPAIEAETLLVAGGLYGNLAALDSIEALAAEEREPATVVLNGDFHWFDVHGDDFRQIEARTARHVRLRGNVETEIAAEASDAGCGCAYPSHVGDGEVARSNAILDRLRETARAWPEAREALARLPMHAVARVGDAHIGIVHGDAQSLAGWRFDVDSLDDPASTSWVAETFRAAGVDAFASSHTCRAAMRTFRVGGRERVVANNGAAGMPNVAGERFGLVTRIAVEPSPAALYRTHVAGVFVEALAVRYDHASFEARFLAQWAPGSAAHVSYWARIAAGPDYSLARAAPAGG